MDLNSGNHAHKALLGLHSKTSARSGHSIWLYSNKAPRYLSFYPYNRKDCSSLRFWCVVCKALDYCSCAVCKSYNASLVITVVVECTVGIGDTQRCVYTLIVGDGGDDLVVTVKNGNDIITVIEILLRYIIFCLFFIDSSRNFFVIFLLTGFVYIIKSSGI